MASHMSPCIQVGRSEETSLHRKGGAKRKGDGKKMERKERKKEREGEAWERERGRKGSRHSDGRNSSDQEVKSVYLMRATLQEIGILPTFVYFHPKGMFVKYGNAAYFDPTHLLDFSTSFRLGNRGNLDSSPSYKL